MGLRKSIIVALLASFVSGGLAAADPGRFFPAQDLTLSGTYYYPEHWPSAQWGRDIKRIAELGFDFIHMAEFSWAAMEPEEGPYAFVWLD